VTGTIVWAEVAQADLAAASDYYSEVDPAFAAIILPKAIATARFLLANRHIGTPMENVPHRKWRIVGTPFLMIYRTTPTGIFVARVPHNRSDWQTIS
jgi:plasmid stabilization system protein ParE